jgi:Domain of unknown function (DUF4349)
MGVKEHGPDGRRFVVRVSIGLVALLVVAACGSAAAPAATSGFLDTVGGAVEAPEPAASAAPSVPGQGERSDTASGGNGYGQQGYVPAIPRDDLKIVYTGSLDLVVDDLQSTLAKARTAVEAVGGYIGASKESNNGDKSVAVITYRIPATRWEDAIAGLRDLATKVVGEQTQATEVGGQLVDLDARIRNLQASEASLQEIAKGTGKISDLLDVEAQLTDVRGQIEQLQGQQAQLTDQVAYGTLVTTFGLEVQQVEATAKGWDPAADVDAASATLIGVVQTAASGLIWFGIVWLPLILVATVLLLVGVWVVRRIVPGPRPGAPIDGWGES